jgi:hypothetical protein
MDKSTWGLIVSCFWGIILSPFTNGLFMISDVSVVPIGKIRDCKKFPFDDKNFTIGIVNA